MTPVRKPVVGLIGAIGGGKSTAAAAFARCGGVVIDCDKLGHTALERPEAKAALVARWGGRVLNADGTANRRAIASIVFPDAAERAALEAVVFPLIADMAAAAIRDVNADPAARFAVLDAAVLLEAGWESACDKIVYADAPREVRLARLATRSGWTAAEVAAREASQWPAERKKARADVVLVNDGPPERLQEQVDHVLNEWGWEITRSDHG